MRVPAINSEVCVVFDDHAMHTTKPIEVTLYGKILKKTDTYIVVGSWLIDDDLDDHVNNVLFTILISTIKSIRKLR